MASPFRFRHFQSRLLVFLFVPLVLVMAAIYLAIARAHVANALNVIVRDLEVAATGFTETIASRNELLAISGLTLSQDFAFKPVYETRDPPTILSAMNNLLERIGNADFIAISDNVSNLLITDTHRPDIADTPPEWSTLIAEARARDAQGEFPEAADALLLDGRPYHLTVEPYSSPDIKAWVALGFELDEDFTREFQRSIAADVSVLFETGGRWRLNGSTLPGRVQQELLASFADPGEQTQVLRLAGADYVMLAVPVSRAGRSILVVLQRSLSEQLAPFERLRRNLFVVFGLGLAALAAALIAIARKVTQPLLQLERSARRIEAGDYGQQVNIPLRDEVGALAVAFNGMARGLAEKERVRNLLGKVVSREIAEELLRKEIELGGEEREVTMLFADVRGFTTLCEGLPPRRMLSLLNDYFSAIAAVIEANGGIVDKYIGDAVMALFGAPVALADAPARAVRTALGIAEALREVNGKFEAQGLGRIHIGIGINTGAVVAGNMGSASRLNYTVIGDGVNLAARLEGLSVHYGVLAVLGEFTCAAAPGFLYQELDLVRVKGKQEAVRIYTPLGESSSASAELVRTLGLYHDFLRKYRAGAFAEAAAGLATYRQACAADAVPCNDTLLELYRRRLDALMTVPPAEWDGVYTHSTK